MGKHLNHRCRQAKQGTKTRATTGEQLAGRRAAPPQKANLAPPDAPHRVAVVAVVVVLRVHIRAIYVEVVHVVVIVASRRPPVAVATLIVGRTTIDVAREGHF